MTIKAGTRILNMTRKEKKSLLGYFHPSVTEIHVSNLFSEAHSK